MAEPGYYNPSPLVQLTGHANETTVVVEGVEMMALVDTGPQISTLTEGFYSEFRFRILPWRFVASCGDRGIVIPYKGYVVVNLIIPGLPQHKEDVLFLIILDNKYGERVPVQLGTLVIDHLVVTMTMEELQ